MVKNSSTTASATKSNTSGTKTIKKDPKFGAPMPMKKVPSGKLNSGCIGLMLAETIEKAHQDPTGWLMSEKLDGVRSYWDGSCLYSRNGHLFYPPKWFKDGLPADMALDGELFTKRDDF